MLEKRVDPAKFVGKKLKVIPFQDHQSTIYDTESNAFWRYELIYRISPEHIISVKFYDSSTCLETPELHKTIFSRYKIVNTSSPIGYSKNNSIFAQAFQERDDFLKSIGL